MFSVGFYENSSFSLPPSHILFLSLSSSFGNKLISIHEEFITQNTSFSYQHNIFKYLPILPISFSRYRTFINTNVHFFHFNYLHTEKRTLQTSKLFKFISLSWLLRDPKYQYTLYLNKPTWINSGKGIQKTNIRFITIFLLETGKWIYKRNIHSI